MPAGFLNSGTVRRSGNTESIIARMLRTALVLIILLLAAPESARSEHALEVVKKSGLQFRDGEVPLYFSPCCEKRASEHRAMVEDSLRFHREAIGGDLQLTMAVVNQTDWESVMLQAGLKNGYGEPFVTPPPHITFIPADDGGTTTRVALAKRPLMTPAMLRQLGNFGLSFEDAAKKVVTFVGLHELGHTQAQRAGVPFHNVRRWFSEFLATYFAYSYLKKQQPAVAVVVETVASLPPVEKPVYTTLEEFHRFYGQKMGPVNYRWYMSQLNRRAIEVYAQEGVEFLRKVKAEFGDRLNEPLTDEQLIERLERISPGFRSWARQTFK
jgi:hypothetical protein